MSEEADSAGRWGHWGRSFDFDFDKAINTDIGHSLDFNTDIDLDKDVEVDVAVVADAVIEGNIAALTGSVEAVGLDTLTELDFSVITVENQYSGIDVAAFSAVD